MVVVGMAVQVVAVDSQGAGHHHTLDGATAAVLGNRRAAIVSVRFPGEQRQRERGSVIYSAHWGVYCMYIYFRVGV